MTKERDELRLQLLNQNPNPNPNPNPDWRLRLANQSEASPSNQSLEKYIEEIERLKKVLEISNEEVERLKKELNKALHVPAIKTGDDASELESLKRENQELMSRLENQELSGRLDAMGAPSLDTDSKQDKVFPTLTPSYGA